MASRIEDLLRAHEGLKLKPYMDTQGKLTIGVGRNLEDKGISEREALSMLRSDIDDITLIVTRSFFWFAYLDQVRKDVVLDMVFNMGVGGFLEFQQMIKAIEAHDFPEAAAQMLDSHWAKQVGNRAVELSRMMSFGEYPASLS